MIAPLSTIKHCFQGAIPSGLVTCSKDGVPNVTYISQVHLLKDDHIAISYQFFNKTKDNLLQNPQASLLVIDPISCVQYRFQLQYVKQQTSGAAFEKVKTKLDAVASMSGMSKVFRLKGIDVYKVLQWECMEKNSPPELSPATVSFEEFNAVTRAISECDQLDTLLDTTLDLLHKNLGYEHSMVLFQNPDGKSLYTIASHGYDKQGAGAEVKLGEGVIGIVASQQKPIIITNMQRENIMADAVRQQAEDSGNSFAQNTRIDLPGLSRPNSQLAVPISAKNQLLGVLFLESKQNNRFTADSQELIGSIANYLGTAILLCNEEPQLRTPVAPLDATQKRTLLESQSPTPDENTIKIRHYKADNSIFIESDYLIKGVAGAILWYLLKVSQNEGRTEFSNQELRREPELCLPEISDNLEARLILLRRRLDDRCEYIKLIKNGRGHFTIQITHPLDLMTVSAA